MDTCRHSSAVQSHRLAVNMVCLTLPILVGQLHFHLLQPDFLSLPFKYDLIARKHITAVVFGTIQGSDISARGRRGLGVGVTEVYVKSTASTSSTKDHEPLSTRRIRTF
jgi:hypothetical protein